MKTKILFFITTLAHGGAERVLVNLANNLNKEKYDISVKAIFDGGINTKYLSKDINYSYVFKRTFRGIKYVTKFLPSKLLHKLFIKSNYDIEIAYLEGPPAKIIAGGSCKKIAWIHIEMNSLKQFTEGFLSKKDAINSYKNFDKIVAVSQNVKDTFVKFFGLNNKITVKYNTNETGKIVSLSSDKVSNSRFKKDELTVCSVAKVVHTKGFDRLLNVHKRLLEENLPHKVYFLGIGEEKSFLEKQIAKYNLQNSFILLGFDENPYKYVANCDLYVCSSRREGFSTAVTEALVVGTPVVSTDCSGAKELLGENNEYGIVVENSEEGLYEGIKKMLSDKELLAHYKKQAQLRGSYFSKEKTVKAVEDMLEGL